jgi:hypothetical protein
MILLRSEERSSSRTQKAVTACRDRKRSAKGGNGINSESASGFMPDPNLARAKGAAITGSLAGAGRGRGTCGWLRFGLCRQGRNGLRPTLWVLSIASLDGALRYAKR